MKHTPQHISTCVPGKRQPPLFFDPIQPHSCNFKRRVNLGVDVAPGGEPFSTLEQRGDAEALQENALLLRGTRAEGSGLPMKVRH
jgi:hypothetical protein